MLCYVRYMTIVNSASYYTFGRLNIVKTRGLITRKSYDYLTM